VASSITIDDAAFKKALADELVKMNRQAEDDLATLGDKTANVARSLCPVDTGRLQDSIEASAARGPDGFVVEIGSDVEYAGTVEFGTPTRSPKPFLRPALAEAPQNFRG
jgi:HK97 gp10 family phage protein